MAALFKLRYYPCHPVHRIHAPSRGGLLPWRPPSYSHPDSMDQPLYKICSAAALEQARGAGRFEGSADDLRDGFIHLSAGPQVTATLAAHFAGRDDLVLMAVDGGRLGQGLRWEPSRVGDLFPHLYGALDLGHVVWVKPLMLQDDGRHRLPDGVVS